MQNNQTILPYYYNPCQELAGLVDQLPQTHTTQDVNEWKGILNEVLNFRAALCNLSVTKVISLSTPVTKVILLSSHQGDFIIHACQNL